MQSVLNAFRVLEEVALRQPVGVSELARSLGLPKTSVQRALITLQQAGWLRAGGEDLTRWYLTTRALSVGSHVSPQLGLREAALPVMNRLRDETGESIHLSILDGDSVFLLERLNSPHIVRTVNVIGGSAPLHASATGKAVLALLPEEQVERILAQGLVPFNERTITDPDRLRAELEEVRRRGYATNMAEWRPDVIAVGRALCHDGGKPFAALNVSAVASRTTPADVARYGLLLMDATAEIEARVTGRPVSAQGSTRTGAGEQDRVVARQEERTPT